MRIKDIITDERPREKMLTYGADTLSMEELLAILINSGTKDISAIEVAKNVIEKAKSIKGLTDITLYELLKIKGIGTGKATRIYAALEIGKRVAKAKSIEKFDASSPNAVAELFMEELRYLKKEVVKLLVLDTKGKIIGDILLSEGNLNSSILHPREIFKEAIIRSANKIILVHNHPSGNTLPSQDDIQITRKVKSAGDIIGIELLDHIIIGDGEYLSLREKGYI